MYPDSNPVGSPVYISCKSKESNPCFPFSPFLDLLSPTHMSPEIHSPHSKVAEGPLQVYENPLFSSQSSYSHIQMATIGYGTGGGTRGGTEGGTRGGGGHHIPLPGYLPTWRPDTPL